MFKIKDTELSTKVTIGKARKLKEQGLVDLMDAANFTELLMVLSDPANRLNILWTIVKDQLDGRDQSWFEDNLEDVSEAFASLDEDIRLFIQGLTGEAFSVRWEKAQEQIHKLLDKEMSLVDDIMNSDQMEERMSKLKDKALQELEKEN